ncbi:hypothetical protein C037_00169 [Brucella suis 63/198]|nr:hypothetical protein C037_00169 [Brucella suis 63/198]
MWALDLLNDTLIIALLPSLLMLVGSVVLLAWFWPLMGLMVAIGSVLYIACTIVISLGFVAPAATLANSWDTRMGGALADSMSCNAVVKAFGAEAREDERLAMVVNKWRSRTRRTWLIGTLNGFIQGTSDGWRYNLRSHRLLHAARLSARCGHAYPQPATLGQ